MPDYQFCPMCNSQFMAEWPEEGFVYCRDCGWNDSPTVNAAEQRNEAISDGQKCLRCSGLGFVELDGDLYTCPECEGTGHF